MDKHRLRALCDERVTGLDIAGFQPSREPLCALLRGAVRERIRDYHAARLSLETIISDCGGGAQRRLDVARLQYTLLLGKMAPNPGQTIRL